MQRRIRLISFIMLIVSLVAMNPLGAEEKSSTTAEPYAENEFPQWSKNLRRTEIITLGSLPFTTLGVTFAFGAFEYFSGATSSFPNPFNKSTSYTGDEIKKIVGISLGVSAVIGITDLVINIVRQKKSANRLKYLQESTEHIIITPVTKEEAVELQQESEAEPLDGQEAGSQTEASSPAEDEKGGAPDGSSLNGGQQNNFGGKKNIDGG